MTKDQERAAIKQIEKIVEELGENSYVGYVMEGVLELAEQNIEENAKNSPKQASADLWNEINTTKPSLLLKEKELFNIKEDLKKMLNKHNSLRKDLENSHKAIKEIRDNYMNYRKITGELIKFLLEEK